MSATLPFGPYELVRRLGSGGMAETFLAVRRGPGGFEQHVCVKRILPALEADPALVAMFMEEARLAAQLRHANITQVVDFGLAAGSHYLALELVDGVDLRTLLASLREQRATLEPAVAVFVATELAAALEFAHTPGAGRHAVIHRDLSPSNVLLSRAGEVYLTDFGIARALGAKHRTQSGVVRGKVPYMAAEYAMSARFDARSDLFALGVILYEALAGQRPFDGVTELDTLTRIKEGKHAPLAALCPAAHPSLVSIVEQLLVPDPDERFQSAAALVEALAHVAPPPTVARRLGELVRAASPSHASPGELSVPSRTAELANVQPAPSYPEVERSSPDAPTRTSDGPGAKSAWASTDPTHVSQHDRPSPYAPAAVVVTGTPSSVPATRIGLPAASDSAPAPGRRRPLLWALIAIGGLVAFAIGGAGAYVIVELLKGPQ